MITIKMHKADSGERVYIDQDYSDKAIKELSGEAYKVWTYLYVKLLCTSLSTRNVKRKAVAPNDALKACNLSPEEFDNAFEELKNLGYIKIEDGVYVFHPSR